MARTSKSKAAHKPARTEAKDPKDAKDAKEGEQLYRQATVFAK